MRLRLWSLALTFSLLTLPAFGRHWTDATRKGVDRTRVGMTVAEAQATIGSRPSGMRLFVREGKRVNESTYPTGEDRWTTLVFEDGALIARRDIPGAAVPPANVPTFSETDNVKRLKLQAVGLGMTAEQLDALGVTPDMVLSSADFRGFFNSEEFRALKTAGEQITRELGLSTPMSPEQSIDTALFDQARIFTLEGETFSVLIKDSKVVELQIAADPDEQWLQQAMVKLLSKRRPKPEDFESIKPGASVFEVIMSLGLPASEESIRTEAGEVLVFKYRPSRRESISIEIQNDAVTRVTRSSTY